MVFWKRFAFLWVVCLSISPVFVEGLDVDLTAPTMKSFGVDIPHTAWDPILNEFEEEIKGTSDIWKSVSPREIARGFANAGAATTHVATQRSFLDYQGMAIAIGTIVARSRPIDAPLNLSFDVNDLYNDGDTYFGTASHPAAISIGSNFSKWADGLRVNVKYGVFDSSYRSDPEEAATGPAFRSMVIGVGANYQIIKALAASELLRWRGVTIGSGFNYLSNMSKTEFTIEDETKSLRTPVTQTDLGVSFSGAPETIGHLVFAPGTEIKAEIRSQSWLIPLELSTGFRLFYLLDVNFGFGTDFTFGHTELTLGGVDTEIDFEPAAGVSESMISVDPGSANLGISEENRPQFIRPCVTFGVSLNLGPLKFDVPMMYYFDQEGMIPVIGVNLGFVW